MEQASNAFGGLFGERTWPWGPMRARFRLLAQAPPEGLISNINLLPYSDKGWVVLQMDNGDYDITGGTREPGEPWWDTLRRELVEEAGAELLDFNLLGAWACTSLAATPYRPHLPFPQSERIVGVGRVQLNGAPSLPPDGERVAAVLELPLELIVEGFARQGRHDLAELYQLGAALRSSPAGRVLRAAKPWQISYPDPLQGRQGDILQVGREDGEYPGWAWCSAQDGRQGWAPLAWLERLGSGEARLRRDYNARELELAEGDGVIVHLAESGWVWASGPEGNQGWAPEHILPGA